MPLHRMYDSAPHIFPPTATTVALYVNGLYRFDPERVRSEWETVLWIDVLGTAPGQASILDIETRPPSGDGAKRGYPACPIPSCACTPI